MTRGIGLDFGTTNSALALAAPSGDVEVVRFASGDGRTESYRSILYCGHADGESRVESYTGPRAVDRYLEHEGDVVGPAFADPMAACLTAVDYDEDPQWWGVAGGGKFAITDKVSLALRGEWFQDDGGARLCQVIGVPFNDATYVSATATLAYELTNNLTARVEFRHDVIDTDPIDLDPFLKSDSGALGREDQNDVGIIEVIYEFD